MRIMLDTNILISVIFFPNPKVNEFIKKICDNNELVICDYVIQELKFVVNRKFPNKAKALEKFLIELPFELVYTPNEIDSNEFPSVRDGKDTSILATFWSF